MQRSLKARDRTRRTRKRIEMPPARRPNNEKHSWLSLTTKREGWTSHRTLAVIAVTSKAESYTNPFFPTHPENTPNVPGRPRTNMGQKGRGINRKKGAHSQGTTLIPQKYNSLSFSDLSSNLSIGGESQGNPCAFLLAGSDDLEHPETAILL